MDYEQKYKDANNKVAARFGTNVAKEIFADLYESEDEKIRKELIRLLNVMTDGIVENYTTTPLRDFIAWLEKQGVQKPANIEPKFHKGDMIIHKELGGDYIHNPHKIIQVDILNKEYRLEGGLVAHFSEEDKYELVEQKPVDSYCQENCKGFQETGKCFADGECKAKREAEQNPAWSEEDERMYKAISIALSLNDAKGYLRSWYTTPEEADNWHKSLKNRVQPQQKQEWSEEDEEKLDLTIFLLKEFREVFQKDAESCIAWLKSIKPQPHWKPTDEQMDELEKLIVWADELYDENSIRTIESLYNDLKKL